MNEIEVIMFQADCGDSFLVTINDEKEVNILIDCGTRDTYYNCIKPKLLDMNKNKKVLDFVILTHMHADHIEGAIHLFRENISNEESNIIQIKNVIYNGFKGLQLCQYNNAECNEYDKAIYEGVIANGISALPNDTSHKISIKQDLFLSSYILKGGYSWNAFPQFTEGVILADTLPSINVSKEATITFLSPNIANIKELNNLWERYLKSKRKKINLLNNELSQNAYEAFMMLISNEESEKIIKKISQDGMLGIDEIYKLSQANISSDTKVENGASIAFLLEFKKKKLLFLGDSFANVYYENLLRLKEKGLGTFFDLIKLSHHGSRYNISDEFLMMFDSLTYLISTNGKHGHPDIETISKIINRKINSADTDAKLRNIIISNATESIKKFDKEELKNKFHYSIQYLNNTVMIIK